MRKADFFFQENTDKLLREKPSYGTFFCSMNCGKPIVLCVDDIYRESMSSDRFFRWLTCEGEWVLDISNISTTMEDKSEIWEIAENHRQQYYNQVKLRYEGIDLQDLVRDVRRKMRKKADLKTSHGIIQRDPIIVITRPLYDFATWYTYAWCDELVGKTQDRLTTIDLGLELATRKNLEKIFSEFSPVMYYHIGHGSEKCIIGTRGEKIIDDHNCDVLKSCIANVTACRTAAYLGGRAIDEGCVAYMGHSENFLFVTKFHTLDRQMQEIYERLRSKGKITSIDLKEIEDLLRRLIIRCLKHDRDSLRLLGDEKARISYGR